MEKSTKTAALYLATLRALGIIHQGNHWLSRGTAFYGNHLLFERIYNSALEDLDAAAEKFVALFGDEVLSYELQADLLHGVLSKYNNLEGSPTQMSVSVEKAFLKLSQDFRKLLRQETDSDGTGTASAGPLTLGLDNMLADIADSREGAVYLLTQSLKGSDNE